MYRLLADCILVLHLAFVLFVVCGGLLAFRRPRLSLLHLPAACWGSIVLVAGWICPLTPLENYFRLRSSTGSAYGGSFIEHYLLPLIYPENISRETQTLLGLGVLLFNGMLYGFLLCRLRRKKAVSGRND